MSRSREDVGLAGGGHFVNTLVLHSPQLKAQNNKSPHRKERGREGGREGVKEGEREGGRKRERGREKEREGGKEGGAWNTYPHNTVT